MHFMSDYMCVCHNFKCMPLLTKDELLALHLYFSAHVLLIFLSPSQIHCDTLSCVKENKADSQLFLHIISALPSSSTETSGKWDG